MSDATLHHGAEHAAEPHEHGTITRSSSITSRTSGSSTKPPRSGCGSSWHRRSSSSAASSARTSIYRSMYPRRGRPGAHQQNRLFGALNTIVLIISSLTMALAVWDAQLGKRKCTVADARR